MYSLKRKSSFLKRLINFRGKSVAPLFCFLHKKRLKVILVLLFGIIIVAVLRLELNKTEEKTPVETEIKISFLSPKLFVVQGEQKKESPTLSLIENRNLIAVTPPTTLPPQVLGTLVEGEVGAEAGIRGEWRRIIEYTVEPGDTLSAIAEHFEISLNTLLWANSLNKNSIINPGQKLIILPVSGILYNVKAGDTLSEIAQAYNGDLEEIIIFNDLKEGGRIYPGDELIIPGGEMPIRSSPPIQYTSSQVPITDNYFLCPIPLSNGQCRLTQGLHYYNAVDFSTEGYACGQPVYAAASGEVLKIKYGYNFGAGNYIRVLHSNNLITHYGHLSKILVAPGQKVFRGDIIGLIGYSGFTIPAGPTGCHLHFAVYSASGRPPLNPFAK